MTPAEAMRAAITRVPSLVALDARDAVHAAAVTWRAAELAGLDVDSPRWVDLLAALRDVVDAAMRLGVDDDAPVSGAAALDWRHAVDAYRDARIPSGGVR